MKNAFLRANAAMYWGVAGAVLGLLLALLAFAPASWLARGLASASDGRLLITETRGSVWNGSGVFVLTGGASSRDAAVLPGRLRWTMGMQGLGLLLRASQDCCINGELQLRIKPGMSRLEIAIENRADWLVRWPAGVLAGLGTPWNTLQLGGSLRLQTHDFRLERTAGQWRQAGQLDLDLVNLTSRVSTQAPLGTYRLSVAADPAHAGAGTLSLVTMEGALQLSGQGSFGGAGGTHFNGEASSAPGREAALDNLLNIIGRRQGARSVISIG